MRRREFITLLGGAVAWPITARAQQSVAKMPRIGIIGEAAIWEDFRKGLRDFGYIEGRNVIVEYRSAEERPDQLAAAATELARLPVDVFVTYGSPATQAAKQTTTTIPIVMNGVGDAIRAGFVTSLAHPEGNITGISLLGPEVGVKRLQLLKLAVPTISRAAFSGIQTTPRIPPTSTSGKLQHQCWAWRWCLSRFADPTSSTPPSPR
jgi:putative ABC transport system substrate-binding protein